MIPIHLLAHMIENKEEVEALREGTLVNTTTLELLKIIKASSKAIKVT